MSATDNSSAFARPAIPTIPAAFAAARAELLRTSAAKYFCDAEPFTDERHERSRIVREVLDSWDEPHEHSKVIESCESVVMSGADIRSTFRSAGGHEVRRRFTAAVDTLEPVEELAILEAPPANEPTLAALAAARSRELDQRRKARKVDATPPVTAGAVPTALMVVVGGLLAMAALLCVVRSILL
jgi:hypothetical protein